MSRTREQAVLAELAEGRLPKTLPAEGEVSPELLTALRQFQDVQRLAICLGRGELTLPDNLQTRGPLVGSLKALHATLRHLSWQAERVAAGDLSQRVDFMGDFAAAFNEMVRQLAERRQLEAQLRQSQKLEAIGRLAGGLAHEMNTPAQYVGDHVRFVASSCESLLGVVRAYREALAAAGDAPLPADVLERLRALEEEADLEFLEEQTPRSARSASEGIGRIAGIVSALKEFANPEARARAPVDLRRALQATLVVSQGQYRNVAAVETDFGEIPDVNCQAGEVNEVFLNLISNAVHAVEDAGRSGQGVIRIVTRAAGDGVQIDVSDNGCGIPPEVAERVFDPFFTTREVGRGSGQGLAVARSVIEEGHRGRVTFDSRPGEGTTFHVWLPAA